MKNVYYIGRFQFDSYSEYKKGMADVKKIKCISDELDINEPGVALRLYTLVRRNEIKFQSVIGEDYLLYLSDLVADDYKDIAEGNDISLAEPGRKFSSRKLAGILCIIVALICFAYFLLSEYGSYQKTREIKKLQEEKEISKAAGYISDRINDALGAKDEEKIEKTVENEAHGSKVQTKEQKKEKPLSVMPEYKDLQKQNADLAGWIAIPGTNIDYPVMQSKDDNEFYLKHNFEKKEDVNGSIFMDYKNNIVDRDTNLIIYGHNMKSGLMFGGLGSYVDDQKFFEEHKTVLFNTLYQEGVYEIVAVCLAKVEYQGEDVFKYYDFINAKDKKDFKTFKENISKMNIYGENVDISRQDELLTLSTCNNYVEDGRMFLIAKKVKNAGAGQ